MNLGIRVALLITLLCAIGVVPACADVTLYDNGPVNGSIGAYTINYGYVVTDSFTLSAPATITGVSFDVWVTPGDTVNSVDWSITSTPLDPAAVLVTAATARTYDFTDAYGYEIDTESFSISGVSLGSGSYWLELQNAVSAGGNPVYWDQNNGPSTAIDPYYGAVGSETFKILGAPEPDAITLLCTLLLAATRGIAAVRRRRARG